MGQSLVQNYMHIVFSTKNRVEMIYPPYDEKFYAYLGGICRELDCQPLMIGGYTDHVHILCMLSKNIKLAKLVEHIKCRSSKWIKSLDVSLQNFYWQDGYGGFSVNPSQVDTVIRYIEQQHEHHNRNCFQKEYLAFLEKYKVDYDERYVWD